MIVGTAFDTAFDGLLRPVIGGVSIAEILKRSLREGVFRQRFGANVMPSLALAAHSSCEIAAEVLDLLMNLGWWIAEGDVSRGAT